MTKKKSLGHNPLAYSMLRHASLDFIKSAEEQEKDKEAQKKPDPPKKQVVSYYLEEQLVDQIKALADELDTSYSAIVNEMLKKGVKEEKHPDPEN